MGDPNGPVFHEGKSHLMYQFFPYWGYEKQEIPGWGHMVSTDFVHWEHWPIAMMPEPGTYDHAACASGACVVDDQGLPTIVYTSVPPQAQSIAVSQDGMRAWRKHPDNPLVNPPLLEGMTDGFRDPFVWREEDGWYMIVGTAIDKVGGAVTLHHSPDLRNWTYLHPLCVGEDPDCMMWECPNLFPLGDKYVLVVSPLLHSSSSVRSDVIYSIGDSVDHRFVPGPWHVLDFGTHFNYYAPNSYADDQGRRLMWGCVGVGSLAGKPWHGVQTLLRELALRPDGRLAIAPIPELAVLRGRHWHYEDLPITAPQTPLPDNASGAFLEIMARIHVGTAQAVGLDVRCTPNGEDAIAIRYDAGAGMLRAGGCSGEFRLLDSEDTLELRIFLDGRVVEVYANGRAALTMQSHLSPKDTGIRLAAEGEGAEVSSLDIWEMASIWR
jgi:beta-fructofuranosidase